MYYDKICVLLLAVMTVVLADADYCDPYLCQWGRRHIACGNNGNFSPNCVSPQIIKITKEYRRQIVRKHNSLRNEIARGFKNIPPATRMATMLWDNELAMLAELNVKQCEMRHDQCRSTPKFPYAGQNLAYTSWMGYNFTVPEIIDRHILEWFNEYTNCPLSVITSYVSLNGPVIGHFTAMVQDKSNRIGCAILRSFLGGFEQQLMACNYAFTNILGAPVYSRGRTASQCTTGTNKRFTSLCSIQEKYNIKQI